MLKKLGSEAKKALRRFFSLCLDKGTSPPSWKTSTIFPIPKAKDWECDLINTRPIILLETSRKLLTKILTNRLSTICKNHNILKGPNYAGLPGESTQEPIHVLNNICEEAREKKKELWICFQDTAKAFDTVNLEMLQKAMERIKIPKKAIEFIIGLFKNRKLKAITSYGLTDKTIAEDGLDQGETISPLLWRIFYDPLLSKIQNNKELGYIMETKWQPNLNRPDEESIRLRTAATAFMDDTTWIASSKSNMQRILDEAAIFYKANDSQVNGKKSVLIAINSPKKDPNKVVYIGPSREPLKKLDENDFTRYLGIWLGEKDQKKFIINLLQREIFQVTQALGKKKTTDKQVLYILNRVLIPRIEYRAQHCFLQEGECKKLTAKYMGKFKNAINISRTCPNSIILHKGFYGLKSVEEIQTEALISNFTIRLNDTGPTGISTKIRLKDAQIKYWEPTNIIQSQITDLIKTRGNLQANILALSHKTDIKYKGLTFNQMFKWKGGLYPIKDVIQDQKEYKRSIKHLAKCRIMFVDQIIDQDNKRIIDWWFILSLINLNNKGPTPKWYKTIKHKITADKSTRLNEHFSRLTFVDNNYKWLSPVSMDNRRKEQVAFLSETQKGILWGKVEEKGKQNNTPAKYIVSHQLGRSLTDDRFDLVPCKGCEINMPNARWRKPNVACQTKVKKGKIFSINYMNKRKAKNKPIPYSLKALEENIKNELPRIDPNLQLSRISPCQVIIEDLGQILIERWIESKDHKEQLLKAYINNTNTDVFGVKTTYEFYTDGSLKNRGYDNSLMGSAWIQTLGPNPNTTFQNSSLNWPSSSKAEAIAIFTALLTVPKSRKVEIFTDSQTCIDILHKLQIPHPKFTRRKLFKIKNWSIWIKIKEAIQSKELKVKLTKVKAHEGDYFNERADQLAKEALNSPALIIKDREASSISVVPLWNNIIIDIPIREFVKEINKKAINKRWTEQRRNTRLFNQEILEEELYEWKMFWEKQNKKKFITSPQDSKKKAFWIKLAQNELPTLDNLATRRPKIYRNLQTCLLCTEENETLEHLFNCPTLGKDWEEIWKVVENKFTNPEEVEEKEEIVLGKKTIFGKIKAKTQDSIQELFKITIGLYSKEDVSELQRHTRLSMNQSSDVIADLCNLLREQFYENIWKKRSKEVNAVEKLLGITAKEKRTRKEKSSGKRTETKKTSRKKAKNSNLPSQAKQDHQEFNAIPAIGDKIRFWIQYRKKWLGI